MTTTKKLVIAVVALSLALVAFASVTLAWLTSETAPVTNTFTAGDVQITLDEADVNEYGVAIDGAERVKENDYKLVPGYDYVKDPTVHVLENSEECYVFVKVVNGLSDIITNPIETQIIEKWTKLEGVDNVYYQVVSAADAKTGKDLVVFSGFSVKGDATNTQIKENDDASIVVTAYAVQKHGFETAKLAWDGNFAN